MESTRTPISTPCILNSSSNITTKTNIFFTSTSKTKPLSQILSIFDLLPSRDTVTFNAAISVSLRHRRPLVALRLFLRMLLSSSDSLPDSITLRAVIRASSQINSAQLLRQIHGFLFKMQEMIADNELVVLHTCLLNGYLACGSFENAREVFVKMLERDVVAFTSMMTGFAEAGMDEEALGVFRSMVESEDLMTIMMNEYVYSCALHVSAKLGCLFGGREIHAQVVKSMMGSDVFVGTGLVDLYVKCNEMESAKKAFGEISEPNVASYNALLAGNFERDEGFRLLSQMRLSGVSPDHVTFASVIRGCKDVVSIHTIKGLHGLIIKMMQIELDVYLSCSLFEAYIDLGCLREAQKVFTRMKEKDDVAYNVAIQGYLRNGNEAEAFEMFVEALKMRKEVREVNATPVLVNGGLEQGKQLHALIIKFGSCHTSIVGSLIRMYSEHKYLDEAIRLFDQIPSPDLVLWTDLISNFSRSGENQGALNLYVNMITKGVSEPPNHYTFSTLLRSCAHLAASIEGKQVHAQIMKSNLPNIESDLFVASSLLYMYSKSGYIEEARRVFNNMPERDLASWNAMIISLAQHGLANEAIETFQQLLKQKDMEPNDITFVGILTACSHGGMVELGYRYFKSIKNPTIEHYTCLISLFARAGQLKEALDFVSEMPYEANEIIWTSLLVASSTYGNVEMGEYCAKKLIEIDPKDRGAYIMLSNIYAAAERWEDTRRIRKLMTTQTDSKRQAVSWLRVDREKLAFCTAGMRRCTWKGTKYRR